MAGAAGKVKALEQWCKARTNGYRDVDVKDMARSWRSGLAFCALIHKYRPDLIDYESLSKENVLANNSLAFQTAERELGIPALLDAEDMARLEVPDRLSIITYVAQYYNYFRDKEPAGGPGVSAPIKRQRSTVPAVPASPEAKRHLPDVPAAPAAATAAPAGVPSKTAPLTVNAANSGSPAGSADLCTLCGKRVYLLERFIDAGQLYHRSCHRQSTGKSVAVPSLRVQSAAEVLPQLPASARARDDESPVNGQEQSSAEENADAIRNSARSKVMSAVASSMQPGFGRPPSNIAASSPGHAASAEQSGGDGTAAEVGADVFAAKLAKLRQLRQKAREAGADDGSERLSRVTQKLLGHKGAGAGPPLGAAAPMLPSPAAAAWSSRSDSSGQTADGELHVDGCSLRPTDPAVTLPTGSIASGPPRQQQQSKRNEDADAAAPRDGGSAQRNAAAAAPAVPAARRPVQPEPAAAPATAATAAPAAAPPRPASGPAFAAIKAAPAEVSAKKPVLWLPSPSGAVPAAAFSKSATEVTDSAGSADALSMKRSAGTAAADTQGLPVRPAQLPGVVGIVAPGKPPAGAAGGSAAAAVSSAAVTAGAAAAAERPAAASAAAHRAGGGTVDAAAAAGQAITAGQVPVKPTRMSKKKKQAGDSDDLEPGLPVHGQLHSSMTLPAGSAPSQAALPDAASDSKKYPTDLNPFGTDDNDTGEEAAPTPLTSPMAPASHAAVPRGSSATATAAAAASSQIGVRGTGPSAGAAGTALAPRSASTIASSRPTQRSTYDSSLNPFGCDEAEEQESEQSASQGPPPRRVLLHPPPPGTASGSPAQQHQQQRKKLVPDVEFDFERSFDDQAAVKKRQKAPAPARPPSLMPAVPSVAPASVPAAPPAASPAARSALAPSAGGGSADVSPAVTPSTARKKKPAPTPPTAALQLTPPTSAASSRPTTPVQQPSSDRQSELQISGGGGDRRSVLPAVGAGAAAAASSPAAVPAASAAPAAEQPAQTKKAKPAPPRPMPPARRSVASAESELGMTLFEVERELQILDQKQQELEEQGRALEEAIRRADAVLTANEGDDELLAKWLDMVNEKNRLVRRESELVYVCKQHSLEERQADIEWDLRQIMNKPERQKTDADKRLEEELLQEMITVVQERNKLVESLDEDRLRQLEEDKEIELAIHSHAANDSPASIAVSKAPSTGSGGKIKTKEKKEKKVKEKKPKAGRL